MKLLLCALALMAAIAAASTLSFMDVMEEEWKTFKGPSIYDVRKNFGILDPLPPCPHLGLIYSTKFMQPPLLHLLLG